MSGTGNFRITQIKQKLSRMKETDINRTEKTGNHWKGYTQVQRNHFDGEILRHNQKNDREVEREFTSKLTISMQSTGNQYQKPNSIFPDVHNSRKKSPTYGRLQKLNESKKQSFGITFKEEDTKDHQVKKTQKDAEAKNGNRNSAHSHNTSTYVPQVDRGRMSNCTNFLPQKRGSKKLEEDEKPVTAKNEQLITPNNKAQMKGRKTPQGLPNIGNTCYANSLLQVLSQTPELYEKVLSCTENHTSFHHIQGTHVTNAFRKLLFSMNSSTQRPKSVTIAEFMNMVSKRDREFSIGYQNDCHSFFLTLLSDLHDENPGEDMTQLFEIKMVDEFTFDTCWHRDVTDTQTMRSLTIPSDSTSVEDGLYELLYEESFNTEDVPCRECHKSFGTTKKAMKFQHLPRVIVLQLGCFQEMNYGNHLHIAKSYKRIGFTKDLTVPLSNGHLVTYHLYGVVNHHGSIYGGHYTSFVKYPSVSSEGGHWYYCDDSRVKKSSLFEAVTSPDAYLLFYSKSAKDP